jgi:hypothetical protein
MSPRVGVHEVQMPLPGRSVSAGTLVRNYGATDVVPIQTDQSLLCRREDPFPNT